MRAGEALGVRDAAGLGDDLQARLVVDQQPQTVADDGVIVGDDDGESVSRSAGSASMASGPVEANI